MVQMRKGLQTKGVIDCIKATKARSYRSKKSTGVDWGTCRRRGERVRTYVRTLVENLQRSRGHTTRMALSRVKRRPSPSGAFTIAAYGLG